MTPQAVYLDAGLEVPNANGAIVRASDEDREGGMSQGFAELETHDAVHVTPQCMDLTASVMPVAFNG